MTALHQRAAQIRIVLVPIPIDCGDRFNEAHYARPEMLLGRFCVEVRCG
jgi:hypothetical protein